MAELKNFGAIFTFAIKLENEVKAYYEGLGVSEAAQAASKRLESLERARREYVVEITLEPIDGLMEENYTLSSSDTSATGRANLEATAKRFYEDAAPKLNVRQAQRVLEKCAKQY